MISACFGYSVRPDTPIVATFVGVVTSLIIATPIALFELHSERIAFVRRLRRLPLAVYFGIKVVFYLVVIVGGLLLSRVVTLPIRHGPLGIDDDFPLLDRLFRDHVGGGQRGH